MSGRNISKRTIDVFRQDRLRARKAIMLPFMLSSSAQSQAYRGCLALCLSASPQGRAVLTGEDSRGFVQKGAAFDDPIILDNANSRGGICVPLFLALRHSSPFLKYRDDTECSQTTILVPSARRALILFSLVLRLKQVLGKQNIPHANNPQTRYPRLLDQI